MSIATLSHLLSTSSQGKWLLVATFLLFSLPVLLPFLIFFSFFTFMLLLPLGCAFVGFLSWHRLRKPATVESLRTIGNDTQESIWDESDSSISDAESTVSAHDLNEIQALADHPLEDFHSCKAITSDHTNANHIVNDLNQGFPSSTDLENDDNGQATILSMFVKGLDLAESQSDLPITNDSDGALSCTEEEALFSEMQLELESFESMYGEQVNWTASHVGVLSDSKQVHWQEHRSQDHSCSKIGLEKRSKASSVSSILSAGSGSVSMMSSTMSSASSASTWSAWSEDQSRNKDVGRLRNADFKSSRESRGPQLGKRRGPPRLGAALGDGRAGAMTGKSPAAGGWRVGQATTQREQSNANRVGRDGVLAQSRARSVTACGRRDQSRRTKGSNGVRLAVDSGKLETVTSGGGGGRAKRGSGVGGSGGARAAKEGAVVRAHKLGVKRVSAEIGSSELPSRDGGQLARDSLTQQLREDVGGRPNRRVSSDVRNESTAEDVRRCVVHAGCQEKGPSSHVGDSMHASENYPQLLEFWRSIEQTFVPSYSAHHQH